jgi:hypothetical protein
VLRKLNIDAIPNMSINIMPGIYFCEYPDGTDEFALGREEIMEINSALDVFPK